jgi:NAD(P)-dependent dehydrogenase (short-subunit alcohol dehydrogenase family)
MFRHQHQNPVARENRLLTSLLLIQGKEGVVGSKENEESAVSKAIALRRMAFAEEQANVLSFLLSDESSYMNGSLVVNDGGFHDIR